MTAPTPRRCPAWIALVLPLLLAGLACAALGAVVVRASRGQSITDWYRLMGGALVGLVMLPLAASWFSATPWHCLATGLVNRFERVTMGSPAWCAVGMTCLWWLTHAVFSLTTGEATYGFDLAIYLQASANAHHTSGSMWLTCDGPPHSYFNLHFEPFLYFLTPLAQSAYAPMGFAALHDVAQGVFLWLALTIIRAQVETPLVRGTLAMVLLANPFWTGLIHFEFHEYGFMPALVLLGYRAYTRHHVGRWAWCCLGLALLRETAAFTLVWIGLLLLVASVTADGRRHRALGLIAVGIGLAQYLLYFRVVLPHFTGRTWTMFSDMYASLGSTPAEIALSPVLRPGAFFQALMDHDALAWLFAWLLSLGLVGLLGWRWFLVILPEIALLWLAKSDTRHATIFHYGGLILPVAVLALARGGHALEQRPFFARFGTWLLMAGLCSAVAASTTFIPRRLAGLCGTDGLAQIPFTLRLPHDVPIVANTLVNMMHASGRSAVVLATGLDDARIDPQLFHTATTHYLLDDRVPFQGREHLREIARCGARGLFVADQNRSSTSP